MKISDETLRQNAAKARELWLDTLPRKDELPEYSASPAFQENMARLLRQGRRVEKRKSFLRSLGRVAAVLLLVTVVSFAGLMTVDAAFRAKILQVFTRVSSEYTDYYYSGGEEGAKLPELRLAALPEGFEVLSDEQFEEKSRHIHCENNADYYLDIDVFVISANEVGTQMIDTEDAQVSVLDIQGREVTVVSKNGWHILLWTEGLAVITVESDIELQEIITCVEKIVNG